MHIFISYASKDGLKYAEILNKILLTNGHKTFFFREQININDRLYSEIGKALHECEMVVMIITEESHSSSEQEREYNVGCSLNKEQGLVKEGVELKKFALLLGRILKKFNDSNAEEIINNFVKEINKFPKESKILQINEKKEMILEEIYNKEKIKKFHKYTLEDYNRSLIIENIAKLNLVEETDGSFIQIGIRPLLDDDIFIDPSFHEYLPGAGRMIAIGEEEYLIKTIMDKANKGEIEKVEFKDNIREFPKEVYEFENTIILLSTKFYVEFFTELMHRIDYEEQYPRLDRRYKIISIPERVLGNKIIIVDKNAIIWEKQKFYNEYANTDEKIDIKIKPASLGKVDITIRSVNKIKYINSSLIKVLDVKE